MIWGLLFLTAVSARTVIDFGDEGACDPDTRPRVITEVPEFIRSPNYPNDYPNDQLCEWLIDVSGQELEDDLSIAFNAFNTEACADCSCDGLFIYDGADDTAEQVGQRCGEGNQSPITASGEQLFLRFVSDAQNTDSGFEIIADVLDTACQGGRLINGQQGSISLLNYDNSANCQWNFDAPSPNQQWQLTFESFGTEPNCCNCDYLAVFDGGNAAATQIGRFTGNDNPPTLISSGDQLTVTFRSDFSVSGPGFIINYERIE